MGRTGTLFACEQNGIARDIVAIAKGLGAGYVPLAARATWAPSGTAELPPPCALRRRGHAVLERLVDDGLVAGAPAKGAALMAALTERLGDYPHVGGRVDLKNPVWAKHNRSIWAVKAAFTWASQWPKQHTAAPPEPSRVRAFARASRAAVRCRRRPRTVRAATRRLRSHQDAHIRLYRKQMVI